MYETDDDNLLLSDIVPTFDNLEYYVLNRYEGFYKIRTYLSSYRHQSDIRGAANTSIQHTNLVISDTIVPITDAVLPKLSPINAILFLKVIKGDQCLSPFW